MKKGHSLSVLLIAVFFVIFVPSIQAAPSPIYAWHTFYGSSSDDEPLGGIATDRSGNIYITGISDTTWSGPAGQSPLHAHSGDYDIFVLKLDSSGAYQWHTFYGSSNADWGYGIVTDGSGNLYLAGYSGATWNGPAGENPLHAYTGSDDIFVLKLDSSGTYQWHTFYGSSTYDDGYAIATDGSENVYVTGQSYGTWDGPAGQSPVHAFSGINDTFLLKLDSSGTYQWHTFYGSSSVTASDEGRGVATDGSGNVYVTGTSDATWSGPTGENPLHAFSGNDDIFVLKVDSSGTYQWHTFYGSGSMDLSYAITTDGSGNAYVTGESSAAWNGPAGDSPLHAYTGNMDIFVLKLNTGGAYQWHTFYGSSDREDPRSIATDGSGNIYVAGFSSATWSGPAGQNPLYAYTTVHEDLFVLKLDSSGAYQWHTFSGATNGTDNAAFGIAPEGSGNVYVTGYSTAAWNGPAGKNPLHAYSGSPDIFVLKLAAAPDLIETPVSDPPASSTAGSSFSVTDTVKNQGSASAGASITSYYLSLDTTKGSGDILLIGSRSVPSLGINETNDGILTVTIPSSAAAGSYFLLACADDTNVVEESDENNNCVASVSKVSVIVSPISVISPNGGETWTGGSRQKIQWSYSGNPGSFVKIELLKGGVVTKVISNLAWIGSGGSGSYNWVIPSNQAPGSDYSIRITNRTNASYTDTSDSNFTIVGPPPPTISVVSPNGGENWGPGTIQTIRWTYTGAPGTYLKIELLKGGILNRTLTSLALTNRGSFSWRIPATQVPGADYSIRIISRTNTSCTDTSDLNFTIGK